MESLRELSKSLEASTQNSLAEDQSPTNEKEGQCDQRLDDGTEEAKAIPIDALLETQIEIENPNIESREGDNQIEGILTPYPQLSNNPPISPETNVDSKRTENRDEEPSVAKSFERSASPRSALHRNKGAIVEKVGESGVLRMHKFSLYETVSKFYIVGADLLDRHFRILQIDRTSEPGELSVTEDDIVYSKKETNQILNAVDEGHKSSGGLKLKCSTWGLLGFIRFTGAYYMLFVTKRSQVAMIGGHYIYQVDGTELIPITTARSKSDKHPEESRFVGILSNLDFKSILLLQLFIRHHQVTAAQHPTGAQCTRCRSYRPATS